MIRLFKYLKNYKESVICILVVTLIYAIIYLFLPRLMGEIVDGGIIKHDEKYILQTGAVMVLVSLLGAVFSVLSSYFCTNVVTAFGRDMRREIFTKITNYSLNYLNKFGTDSLMIRSSNDVTQVQQVLNSILRTVILAPIFCFGGIIMMGVEGRNLQWILWVAILALVLFTTILMWNLLPIYEKIQLMIDKMNAVLRENLIGVRVIRAFNRKELHQNKFNEASLALSIKELKANRIDATFIPVIAIVMNFTTLAILWYGGIEVGKNSMQIGSILAFMQYGVQILSSVIMIATTFIQIPRGIVCSKRINEVLEIELDVKDASNMESKKQDIGIIEFKNVCYKYSGADEAAIEDVSFLAKSGQVTAIIGGTGSGKSTILNLIIRFFDVVSGSILIDGIDIREITQEELRSKIGFVSQESLLFTGTIEENIRFGDEDATNEEVYHAAKVAQADDFIKSTKEGFNSKISKGGVNISGGQRQRLSIARAIVKKASIYLFDDCFSALDMKTDYNLRAALKTETINKTVLIVSQRISAIMEADQIIVMDDGKVAGIGTHKELIENCTVYKEIVESQLRKEEAI